MRRGRKKDKEWEMEKKENRVHVGREEQTHERREEMIVERKYALFWRRSRLQIKIQEKRKKRRARPRKKVRFMKK